MPSEVRRGFAFNNPDRLANNGWGAIVTPDELRYIYAYGLPLEAPASGHVYTDEMLNWYIDTAIGTLEQDLSFTLMKRQFRARTTVPTTPRTDIPNGETYDWEEPYDYVPSKYNNFMYVKLRRRPILDVQKVLWCDPMGNSLLDLTNWQKVNHHEGSIEFYPTGSLGATPLYMGSVFPFLIPGLAGGSREYPDALFIDYTAGFENADELWRQHKDLIWVVGRLSAMNLLIDYGEGVTAALASSSVGLSGISESFSSTMSAENTMFTARIKQFAKDLATWYEKNKLKYTGILIAGG